jgi:hypothetical protein
MLEPMWKKSSVDNPDPRITIPYALMLLPARTKLLILHALPKLQKSRTESEDPRFETP